MIQLSVEVFVRLAFWGCSVSKVNFKEFNTMQDISVTRHHVSEKLRLAYTARLFGVRFPMNIEPAIYAVTRHLASAYDGGYWGFYHLSNGGFYMAPSSGDRFSISCDNGFEGNVSADVLGIIACLYAYSHLSFTNNEDLAEICTNHYHWLREYMLQHAEAQTILKAID
jgi:hypothetical protein